MNFFRIFIQGIVSFLFDLSLLACRFLVSKSRKNWKEHFFLLGQYRHRNKFSRRQKWDSQAWDQRVTINQRPSRLPRAHFRKIKLSIVRKKRIVGSSRSLFFQLIFLADSSKMVFTRSDLPWIYGNRDRSFF